RSTGQGAKKPFDPQRPEKNMGPGWRQRPRTFAPQASVMAAGVRDDVGYEYTCFMRGGEDARLHGRFSGEEPLPCAIFLKLCRYASILGHQLHRPSDLRMTHAKHRPPDP